MAVDTLVGRIDIERRQNSVIDGAFDLRRPLGDVALNERFIHGASALRVALRRSAVATSRLIASASLAS